MKTETYHGYKIRYNPNNRLFEFRVPVVTRGEVDPATLGMGKEKEFRCVSTLKQAEEEIDGVRLIIAEGTTGDVF